MLHGSSHNTVNDKFHSGSLKAKIVGVGIKDVPDKPTERLVSQTFQEYSRFNCYNCYRELLWLYLLM